MLLHSDRYSVVSTTRKAGAVLHTAESSDHAAGALVGFLKMPGDRVIPGSNPPRRYGSGYHGVTDGNGGWIEVATAEAGPYAAPPLNKTHWHVCMPGRAAQTREAWLDQISFNHIRGAAKFVYEKHLADGFPLVRLNPSQLLAGDSGYCDHGDVSDAWGQTDHTDVGPNFPWDVFQAELFKLLPTIPPHPGDPTMPNLIVVVGIDEDHANPWRGVWNGVSISHIRSEDDFNAFYKSSIRLFELHPDYNTLAAPFWMRRADINHYAGRQVV